jgi:hypothetical protein
MELTLKVAIFMAGIVGWRGALQQGGKRKGRLSRPLGIGGREKTPTR